MGFVLCHNITEKLLKVALNTTPFCGVCVTWSLVFCVMFFTSLFVLLLLIMHCLFCFYLWLMITPLVTQKCSYSYFCKIFQFFLPYFYKDKSSSGLFCKTYNIKVQKLIKNTCCLIFRRIKNVCNWYLTSHSKIFQYISTTRLIRGGKSRQL